MDCTGILFESSIEGVEPIQCPVAFDDPDTPLHNELIPRDVDRDGKVSPLDVLSVVNDINKHRTRQIVSVPDSNVAADVSGDGLVSAADVLLIVNELNRPGRDTALTIVEDELAAWTPEVEWDLRTVPIPEVLDDGQYLFTLSTANKDWERWGPWRVTVDLESRETEWERWALQFITYDDW